MKYKTIETTVPDWATFEVIDGNGDKWVYEQEPKHSPEIQMWHGGGAEMQIGKGRAPDDASKELYRLEWVWE